MPDVPTVSAAIPRTRPGGMDSRARRRYDESMTRAKVAVTIPADVLKQAREQVKAGRAKSLSALVTDAVEEKVRRDQLLEILDEMDVTFGRPSKEDERWAKRVLKR